MQGEFRCEPSDIYAQAHALQSYIRCSVHGFFSACPCVLADVLGKSRTKSQVSSDLNAPRWYIDHKLLAGPPPDYIQWFMGRDPTIINFPL